MKTKICLECGEPFLVIERGDDPAQLEKGAVYLGESADTCLDCHRKAKARELARYGRDQP